VKGLSRSVSFVYVVNKSFVLFVSFLLTNSLLPSSFSANLTPVLKHYSVLLGSIWCTSFPESVVENNWYCRLSI